MPLISRLTICFITILLGVSLLEGGVRLGADRLFEHPAECVSPQAVVSLAMFPGSGGSPIATRIRLRQDPLVDAVDPSGG